MDSRSDRDRVRRTAAFRRTRDGREGRGEPGAPGPRRSGEPTGAAGPAPAAGRLLAADRPLSQVDHERLVAGAGDLDGERALAVREQAGEPVLALPAAELAVEGHGVLPGRGAVPLLPL